MVSPYSVGQPINVDIVTLRQPMVSGATTQTIEEPIFVAHEDCKVKKMYIITNTTITPASDTVTSHKAKFDIINKGTTGTGSDIIASFQAIASSTSGITLTAYKAHDVTSGTVGEVLSNVDLDKNDVVTCKVVTFSGCNGVGVSVGTVWEKAAGRKASE